MEGGEVDEAMTELVVSVGTEAKDTIVENRKLERREKRKKRT